MINTAVTKATTDSPHNKTLLGKVIEDLGGATFAVTIANHVFKVMRKGPRNKYYQGVVRLLQSMTPIAVMGHIAYNSVKDYYHQKEGAYDKVSRKIAELLKTPPEEVDDYSVDFGRAIIEWLIEKPKTKRFKILDYMDENFQPIPNIRGHKKVYVFLEHVGVRFMLEVSFSVYGESYIPNITRIHHGRNCYGNMLNFKKEIFGEFIRYFDTKKNVIIYDRSGLSVRPRSVAPVAANHFDILKFTDEIERFIGIQRKRGYAFIGPPGNGKTLILKHLEAQVKGIPFVYVVSSAFKFEGDIRETFEFLKIISPCIVIFEDLDTFGLMSKGHVRLGEFIEGMDSSRSDAGMIVISTLNNSKLVHKSLLNRRGRFDKVRYIGPPINSKQAYDVFCARYMNNVGRDDIAYPLPMNTMESITRRIVDEQLSRADICEMVDMMIVNNIETTVPNLKIAMDEVLGTKEAISKCQEDEPLGIDSSMITGVADGF